ncbi:MAG: citrate/2-methylcitrate synthase [Aliidongia sp.]
MSEGLEGVVAAETVLSHVDGEAGRLIYRGHAMEDLAGHASYEAVAGLFWDGFAGTPSDEASIRAGARCRTPARRGHRRAFAAADRRADAGRRVAPAARRPARSRDDPASYPGHGGGAGLRRCPRAAPVRPGAGRARSGDRPGRGFPADAARCAGPAEDAAALDTYLVAVLDHGLNASTFAARVVASTRAGMISSVVAALCALKGPLHGGAPGPVLDMLDAIGSEENIDPWLAAAIEDGGRLMGFGHRIYRVRDPRADVLKAVALRLRGGTNWIAIAELVERRALALLAERKPGRRLDTNVEFYTALVLDALALPRDLFTPVFAMGRVAGWAAHVLEQERSGRIIRPQSRYVGPMPKPLRALAG